MGNIQLHRVPMAKWLPPNGFTGKVHHMDARVGGNKMSFTHFTTGKSHRFSGTYVELQPGKRLRYTDQFDDPNLPGQMVTTVSLAKVSCGTELKVVQEGIPGAIPVEACYLAACRTLVGRAANPSVRSLFPPLLGPWNHYGPAKRRKSVLAQPNSRLDQQSPTGC